MFENGIEQCIEDLLGVVEFRLGQELCIARDIRDEQISLFNIHPPHGKLYADKLSNYTDKNFTAIQEENV